MDDYKNHCLLYCIKAKTPYCPNSDKCFAIEDKPYFELDKSKLSPFESFAMAVDALATQLRESLLPSIERMYEIVRRLTDDERNHQS